MPVQIQTRGRLLPWVRIHQRLALWLAVVIAYELVVAYTIQILHIPNWAGGVEQAASLGFILGILVVFRNNAAYERWWEARKLWGQLINESRNLASKVRAYADVEAAEQYQVA